MNFVTTEAVGKGHPDKVADQISDAILDEYMRVDPDARVAAETLVTGNKVILAGEISSKEEFDISPIVRGVLYDIGYHYGGVFDAASFEVINLLQRQSPNIHRVSKEGLAGDQGIVYGFASSSEDLEHMPLPAFYPNLLMRHLSEKQVTGFLPDAKCQLTFRINEDGGATPKFTLDTAVIAQSHEEHVEGLAIAHIIAEAIYDTMDDIIEDPPTILVNSPDGRFTGAGPAFDTGLTGRKLAVDTYGGLVSHGGGAFSGKDPSKIDRSAAYLARWIAKSVVFSYGGFCKVHIAYAFGVHDPVAFTVFTGHDAADKALTEWLSKNIDMSIPGIIERFDLQRPIYYKTAFGGHFGREPVEHDKLGTTFPWEVPVELDIL